MAQTSNFLQTFRAIWRDSASTASTSDSEEGSRCETVVRHWSTTSEIARKGSFWSRKAATAIESAVSGMMVMPFVRASTGERNFAFGSRESTNAFPKRKSGKTLRMIKPLQSWTLEYRIARDS